MLCLRPHVFIYKSYTSHLSLYSLPLVLSTGTTEQSLLSFLYSFLSDIHTYLRVRSLKASILQAKQSQLSQPLLLCLILRSLLIRKRKILISIKHAQYLKTTLLAELDYYFLSASV